MADKILPQRVINTNGNFCFCPSLYFNCQAYILTATHFTPFIVHVLATVCLYTLYIFSHTQIRELVPESQAYMDLLAFERKLDQTIMRKRLDIQEALKRPIKVCVCS